MPVLVIVLVIVIQQHHQPRRLHDNNTNTGREVAIALPITTVGGMELVRTMDPSAVLLPLVTKQQQRSKTIWEAVRIVSETPDGVGLDTIKLT